MCNGRGNSPVLDIEGTKINISDLVSYMPCCISNKTHLKAKQMSKKDTKSTNHVNGEEI